jgi:DNA-directed RNA polymerase subunit L
VKGIGREHAKYSSTNVCTFQENEKDDTILFFLETNQNVNALSMFRLSLEIISEKIQKMKMCLKLRVKDFQSEIKVPFSETIMNPLQYYIHSNFANEIDLFLYKRNHVLDTISSNVRIFSTEGKKHREIINNALDYFDMDIKFLESSVMNEIFGVA